MKIKILFSIAAAALMLASCKKFLTTESPSKFTQEYIFSNTTDATKAVGSVYALFNQDAFTSRVSNNFTGNSDIEVGGVSASPDNSRRDIWSFEATPANADLLTVWNNAYNAINRANECIEGIEASSLYQSGDKIMLNLLGEAKVLRAYWYYLLINNWGDVPFKTTATKAGDDFYLPKTDRNKILSFLIDDLAAAEPKMQWADGLTYGIEQINREFTIGFIARLSLQRAGYALYPDMTMKRGTDYMDYYKKADEYCKKLMTLKPHTLNPSFAQVFLNECKYIKPLNDDVLYEVAFQPGAGDVAWCNGVRVDGGSHAYGAGSNYLSLTPNYYVSFDTLDTRLQTTCSPIYYAGDLQQTPTGITAIAPGKWDRRLVPTPLGSSSAKGTGINWPLMRYSDVLLMLAEAQNEINGAPTADAKEALKKVRQRAFPSATWATKVDAYITTASASKDAFFNAIVDERSWEFGGECLRKYDLARWNLFGKKVAAARNQLNAMGADANAGSGTYANLPNYLYYRLNTDKTLTWYNRYNKVNAAPSATGYVRLNWTIGLYSAANGGPSDFAIRTWRGYADNTGVAPLRYIMPIHSSVITSSLGVLKNDGYGFNF